MGTPLKITCLLSAPLCGDAPHLDALLEFGIACMAESIERDDKSGRHRGYGEWLKKTYPDAKRHSGHIVPPSRAEDAPPMGILPIPIERKKVGDWLVAKCSSPIIGQCVEDVEYRNKRIQHSEIADFLGGNRKSLHHGTGETKAMHRPLRVRDVGKIVWFCVGYGEKTGVRENGTVRHRNAATQLRRRLRPIRSVGSHRDAGYGRVSEWIVEPTAEDLSWFAMREDGHPVAMRPLPRVDLPANLCGFRESFGACCPPYWHPQRYTEIIEPC